MTEFVKIEQRDVNSAVDSPLLAPLASLFATGAGTRNSERARLNDCELLIQFLVGLLGREPTVADLSMEIFVAFIEGRLEDAPKTSARRAEHLSAFHRWLANSGFIKWPLDRSFIMRPNERTPRVLSDAEVAQIRRSAAELSYRRMSSGIIVWEYKMLRAWLAFEICLELGLRPCETVGIRVCQLDKIRKLLLKVPSTGFKFSDIPLIHDLPSLLETFLPIRRQYVEASAFGSVEVRASLDATPVFASTYSASKDRPDSLMMGIKTFYRDIENLGRTAGIESVNARLLRNTFLLKRLNDSSSLSQLSAAARLSSREAVYPLIRRLRG